MAKIYVITGPAGVGKSTVTNALANKISNCAILEGDEIYNQVVGGAKPWQEGNHLDVMWKNLISLARNYLESGIDVILNYIVYKDRLTELVDALSIYEVHFVLLMASVEIVTARDNERAEDVQVHRANTHIEKFNNQGYDKKFILNTEDKTIEQEVDDILTGRFLFQNAVDKSHISGLQKMYFDMVKSGEKIYELRLNDEKRKNIKAGDDYVFGLEPDRISLIRKKIKERLDFKNFNEACEKLDYKKAGFLTREEMKIVYNTIYSKASQESMGVVCFVLE